MFYTDPFRFEGFLFPATAHAPLPYPVPSAADAQASDPDQGEKETPDRIIVPQSDE